jgi:pyridoxamine-phosphate oxidase
MKEQEQTSIQDLRVDYKLDTLERKDLADSPIQQFERWFQQAQEADQLEPNAMTLATVDEKGMPAARIVLLKGMDEEGFRFYTNYDSEKGQEIAKNPQVALVFFWGSLQRQVRILGTAERLTEAASTTYFQSRPKGSQIGAWASPQSRVVPNRQVLEEAAAALEEKYADAAQLPKPSNWGGYIVRPYQIEFWQGRSSRLHDRLRYTLTDLEPKKEWKIERLAP